MIKDSALTNELFVVLTLPQEDISPLTQLQEKVAATYDLFPDGQYPELHITLDKVQIEAVQTAIQTLRKIAANNQQVKIQIDDFTCFDNNFLVLNVAETDSLLTLSNTLHNRLSWQQISTIHNYQDWKFHITLISDLLSDKSIPQVDFNKMCLILEGISHPLTTYAQNIELWRPTLDPEDKVIASYSLE